MFKDVIEEAKYAKTMVCNHWFKGTITFGLVLCMYAIAGLVQ